MSQLKNSLLKAALGAGLLGMVALPQSATAQVGVVDTEAISVLRDIERHTNATQEDTDKIQDFHLDKTAAHYESEIARLNKMIDSLSYRNPSDEEGDEMVERSEEDEEKFKTEMESDGEGEGEGDPADSDTFVAKKDVGKARTGESNRFGIVVGESGSIGAGSGCEDDGGEGASFSKYLCEHGLVSAEEIYQENEALKLKLLKLHSALYMTEATVGEVDAGREGRFAMYEHLLEEAKKTNDVMEAMEVNNAILLENGRNLATLIDLQTASLNAQAAELRDKAQAEQRLKATFGESGAGDTALTALLTQVVF